MKTKSAFLKIFLVLTLSLSAFAAMPASSASASTTDSYWNACGGTYAYGTNKYGQGWVIAKVSNSKCSIRISSITYVDYTRKKQTEGPSAWGSKTAGMTTRIAMRKGEWAHINIQIWSIKYGYGQKKVDAVISR